MSRDEKLLLKTIGIFYFTISFSGIFLNVYLFKLGGFRAIAEYGMVSLSVLFILYIASGYFLKYYSQIFLVKTGLLFLGMLYFSIFILRERSLDYIVVLGILGGIGHGTFWPGYNLTQYISTRTESRNEYFGKQNFLVNSATSTAPLIAGGIISYFGIIRTKELGYNLVFLIVAILFFYIFLSLKDFIKQSGVSFSIKDILEHKRTSSWRIVLSQQFFYGLLILLIVKEEVNLGFVNFLSAATYALANLLAIKIIKKNKDSYLIGSILGFLGLLIFGLQQNLIGLFSLIFINNIFLPLLNIQTAKLIYDVIDETKTNWKEKYHFLVERDSALGVGRIITYLILLIFLTRENSPEIAKNWILFVPVFPLLIGFLQFYYFKLKKEG